MLEDNIGSKISYISSTNMLANISPRVLETKEKINKWDYFKFKSFSQLKKPTAR